MTTTNATLPIANAGLPGLKADTLVRAAVGARALALAFVATMRELFIEDGQENADLRKLYRLCSYGDGVSPGLVQALRERDAA